MMIKNPISCAVSLALIGGAFFLTTSATVEADPVSPDAEEPAPYTLKIITHGEGTPSSANDTPAALQQNRRVDVSLQRKVPAAQASVTTEPDLAAALADETTGSGTYWISQDPAVVEPFLGIKAPATATVVDGALENPVKISVATNYGKFVQGWELRILPFGGAVDADPLFTRQGQLSGAFTDIEWNGELGDLAIQPGDKYDIAIRVYDASGNFDQSQSETLEFIEDGADILGGFDDIEDLSIASLSERLEEYQRDFAQRSIPVVGSTVIVRGQNLADVQSVEVDGEKIIIEEDNSFAVEYILPPGEHKFDVATERKSGGTLDQSLDVRVKSDYFFMVGLADLTVGANNVSGSVEPLAVDDRYNGDIFVDGRLAFYLKGKVQGKYLLTARLDTGTEDVSELFDDFNRQDPGSVFRRLDPDEYYLVYGDDSSVYDDTDSQGKLYLRVNWDDSHALWGNFNTAFSGTEFAAFNRSLYGAQYRYLGVPKTSQGDRKTELSAFISEAQTIFRHNEFIGTGGSLYYLRDQDIVIGSEKVSVEVRRDNSEQVVQRIELIRGRDYEIDEFQGRILLTRPLLSISAQSGPSIIRDEPQPDDNTYLVVDYEFVPSELVTGDAAAGVRAKRWINDYVSVGGTWAHENRDTDDFDVKGVDVVVKKTDSTYLRFEAAQSNSEQTGGSFTSTDGGLSFTPFASNAGAAGGNAVGVEARVFANDLIEMERDVSIAAWAKNHEAGFSTSRLDSDVDTLDAGIEVVAEMSDVLALSGRATRLEQDSQSLVSVVAVQADYNYTEHLTVSGELRRTNDEDLDTGASEAATLAAGKLTVDINDSVTAYGIAQGALDRSGNAESNTLLTAGASAKINQRTSLSGEISSGDRGIGALFGVEHKFSDTYGVYSNISLLDDRLGTFDQTLTLGQRKELSEKLNVYTEHQFNSEDPEFGMSNTIGLTTKFSRFASGTLSYQSSRVEDESEDVTSRDTVSAGFSFKRNLSRVSSKLEFRQDKSDTVDTDQWVTTNNIEYRRSASLRWQFRLNHSLTEDKLSGDDARFTEAGIGFAYRPVAFDRLNMLGRYTFLSDLPPLSQSDLTDKRSSIFSFESIYELGHRWSVGGKLAHREGEIRTQRENGVWVGNDASVAALRLRYKVPFGLDAMGSYQWLSSDASESGRQGVVLSLGHNIGSNLQFSVGYNFTSFDDDLSNDDYDVSGWFLNLVGKY